jgi:hypothetical protein
MILIREYHFYMILISIIREDHFHMILISIIIRISFSYDSNKRISFSNVSNKYIKRISFSYDSNKSYLSYQNIKSYVSSLNNSSLSNFLFVTITPYRKDLLLTESEVIDQTEEVQEIEMEVQEVEGEVDSLHAVPMVAGKDIRALLDTGCLVGDCISKRVVDSLNASDLLFDVATTI